MTKGVYNSIYVDTKKNKCKRTSSVDRILIKRDSKHRSLFYKPPK